MKKLMTMALITALNVSSIAFANPTDSKEAAIAAFKKSAAVEAAGKSKCGGSIMNREEPVAVVLHEGDVMGRHYPILVIQELGCVFSSTTVAAIVKTATLIDQNTFQLIYDTQEPVVVDLNALVK